MLFESTIARIPVNTTQPELTEHWKQTFFDLIQVQTEY